MHIKFLKYVHFYLMNANIAVNSVVKPIYYYFDNGSSGKKLFVRWRPNTLTECRTLRKVMPMYGGFLD